MVTNVYEILKEAYKEDKNIAEETFMENKKMIERSYEWLLYAIALCTNPFYPRKVRINAQSYAQKLLRQLQI